ncbi:hypothetical protein DPMN_093263 [Dreissena polymorpha]|uniref:Uncharacterized protein n=1 Tax=Dreissena polymorpha TaxID=45954 RepID=A0A9D4L2M0_DREPO|nr:hypothetical protein DPMN_093263 [Dreissena polymorpha]
MCSETKPEKKSVESPNETIMISQTGNSEPPFGIDVHRYSSATKLIRITAWCRRFLLRLRDEKANSKCLTSEELQEAEMLWLKHVQVKHYSSVFESIILRNRQVLLYS